MTHLVQHDRSDPHKKGWPLPACLLFPAEGYEEFPGTASGPQSVFAPGLSRGLTIHPAAISPQIAVHLAAHLKFANQPTPDGEALNVFHDTFRNDWSVQEVYCSDGALIDTLIGKKERKSLLIGDDELRDLALDPERHEDQRWIDFRTLVVNGKRVFTLLPIPGWPPQIAFRVVIDVERFAEHDGTAIRHSATQNLDMPASHTLLRPPMRLFGIEAARHAPTKAFSAGATAAIAAAKLKGFFN